MASILDLPAADVPNFANACGDSWSEMYNQAREWLGERGLGIYRTYCSAGWTLEKVAEWFSADNPGVPVILMGRSGRKGATELDNHAVVLLNGAVAHDPSGVGLAGPCADSRGQDAWWWLDIIAITSSPRLP
ncbi:MAG TPA: hypothetical protein VFS91_00070 [Nitrobacter sp.]|nr:hypothetical protein [Nitrobacter sp.]